VLNAHSVTSGALGHVAAIVPAPVGVTTAIAEVEADDVADHGHRSRRRNHSDVHPVTAA
jgi:hypothetical protein